MVKRKVQDLPRYGEGSIYIENESNKCLKRGLER